MKIIRAVFRSFLLILLLNSFSTKSFVVASPSDPITYADLIQEIDSVIKEKFEQSESIKNEFKVLVKTHKIADSSENFKEFVRVKLIFEATRDSGLWKIRWKITDQEPNSINIWNQWKRNNDSSINLNNAVATAEAECDELSALFAMITRSLGVKKVGLFWPTYNHTVAVWTVKDANSQDVRIVVPTSQIFISDKASLGTFEFDPYQQKIIYDYNNKDIPNNFELPSPLVKEMIKQIEIFGELSQEEFQSKRNAISKKIGGS